jgi:hypothetical protein
VEHFYRRMLWLYPARYRREYADEMTGVFLHAQADACRQKVRALVYFYAHETGGLLAGALREHFHCNDWNLLRRFDMRPEFRFPRSTIVLMLVILAGVVLAIEEAEGVAVKYSGQMLSAWSAFPGFIFAAAGLACAAALGGWAILSALKRSGAHRLADMHTDGSR